MYVILSSTFPLYSLLTFPSPAAALKLSILFPSLVLSLTLVGAPTLFAPPRNLAAFREIVQGWTHPTDEDEWEDVVGGIAEFLLGEKSYEGAGEWWDRVCPTVARVR